MYDHSYNARTLAAQLRRSDFPFLSKAAADAYKKAKVNAAVACAATDLATNPLEAFHLHKKAAYRSKTLEQDLVVRKLSKNIERFCERRPEGRNRIVQRLSRLLEEGVPYRVYRLDVRKFYESFSHPHVETAITNLAGLSPKSKRQLRRLLNHYAAIGGQGLPRGMGISAVLSDFLMRRFDKEILNLPNVYFYARYVDDLLILTNASEQQAGFLQQIGGMLPPGLHLNTRKTAVTTLGESMPGEAWTLPVNSFEYLGYQFQIEPLKAPAKKAALRNVRVEIASSKITKIKCRIARAFLDFSRTGDGSLLAERIKFLTSNFCIIDKNSGRKRLAGIYHGYPNLSANSTSLRELDTYLRNAILSGFPRPFGAAAPTLWGSLKRALLGRSFERGHGSRHFVHFTPVKTGEIQGCWIHE